ncbi:tetratricopeptide repeat protein 39B-like isoform X2 [Antedon mediterranea]|uniref:tetratricopeptide repeat protein 39B-like isoform X2 n=1 Tax=Antedon mediterranea TaxID=105859 RepID=UPI003AF7D861
MVESISAMRRATEMDLETAIEECTIALNLFFNNHFNDAKMRMRPWAQDSMYHALGYGTICFLQAIMTFDPQDIQDAVTWIKNAVEVCHRCRKRQNVVKSVMSSMVRMVQRPNFNTYTDEEVHGELCYAESLLQRAMMSFIQDENLVSFIKGGMKIRSCYSSYKECVNFLESRNWRDERSRTHYESGVKLGIGTFNLMISMLPKKILRLLEFVGFSGNREFGLAELEKGRVLQSLRAPLCSSVLICFHSIITHVFGTADGDREYARRVLAPCLDLYPNGALFLFYAGRVEEISGNIDVAIEKFEQCIEAQQEWKQFHHLCFWELMWCHAFKLDWLNASKYAEKLCQESRWSKSTYYYQQASFLTMCPEQSQVKHEQIMEMYGKVEKYKQRIAGKSVPYEKFAVHKAKKFSSYGTHNSLAGLELIYVWNGFTILGTNKDLLEPVMNLLETKLRKIVQTKDSNPNYYDSYGLAMLLKGMCLRYLKRPSQAELCFQEVNYHEERFRHENYLAPYSLVELALLYMDYGRDQEAKQYLKKARHNYRKYPLENRLHFRMHSAMNAIKKKMGDLNGDLDDDEIDTASLQGAASNASELRAEAEKCSLNLSDSVSLDSRNDIISNSSAKGHRLSNGDQRLNSLPAV